MVGCSDDGQRSKKTTDTWSAVIPWTLDQKAEGMGFTAVIRSGQIFFPKKPR